MKRILGLGSLSLFYSVALLAAKNEQTFYIPVEARVGNIQIPRGICEVTWSAPTGSRVQLTIETEGQRTITTSARMVDARQEGSGVVTSVVNGVTYLKEFHTKNARFVLPHSSSDPK